MIIGLDIGTTNTKAVALDALGRLCAQASFRNQTITPHPYRSVQDPEKVVTGIRRCLKSVISQISDKRGIRAVSVSSAMHSLLPVDRHFVPLTPLMLWSDNRAADITRELINDGTFFDFTRITGVPLHPMAPVFKIMWLKRSAPEVFEKTQLFLGIKEYFFRLATGSLATDMSVASATGLLETSTGKWSKVHLDAANIREDQLPPVCSPYYFDMLNAEWTRQLGLLAPIPLVIGASDGALANLGSDPAQEGRLVLTIGTSAAIRRFTRDAVTTLSDKIFRYRFDQNWCIIGGASNNGGNTLEWLRRQVLMTKKTSARLIESAADVPPGADGLLFLPYLQGERAPVWNANIRATFAHIDIRHRQAHFVRAAMEGILLNMNMVEIDLSGEQIFATGGFTNSALWLQMLADIFEKTVVVADTQADASALGAVITGRKALGLEALPVLSPTAIYEPDRQNAAVYRSVRARFGEMLARATELA